MLLRFSTFRCSGIKQSRVLKLSSPLPTTARPQPVHPSIQSLILCCYVTYSVTCTNMSLYRPPEMPWHNEVYKKVSLGKRTAASINGNVRVGGKNQTARERNLRMNERASVFTEIRFADNVACLWLSRTAARVFTRRVRKPNAS